MSSELTRDNPYPGPRPFQMDETDSFFGREEEKEDLITLVSARRLLFLYAESGIGKTSLLNASLIPALKKEGFDVLPVVRVGDPLPPELNLSPEEIRNIFVLNTLLCWSAGAESDVRSFLQQSIGAFLGQRESTSKPLVLIFDQFEELFTSYPERWREREDFFLQLSETMEEAFKNSTGLRVLFSLREDYLAVLDAYAELLPERPAVGYRLERMRREAAQLAIERPLEKTHRRFASGVALRLVDKLLKAHVDTPFTSQKDVLGEFVEPVHLQIVCHTLWERLPPDAHEISIEHLGLLGGINKPLADFYDAAIKKVVQETRVREEEVRNWFERNLITPAKTRGTVFVGEKQTGGLSNDAVQLLDRMYLIKSAWRANARWYELTHDRFIEPILQSNQRWKEKNIKVEEKGEGRSAFLRWAGRLVFFLAAFSGTIRGIAPPEETGIAYLATIASFSTLILMLLFTVLLKRLRPGVRTIIWWALAITFLSTSILFFTRYRRDREFINLEIHMGTTAGSDTVNSELQKLSEFLRKYPGQTRVEVIESFQREMVINYLGLVLSVSCALFCILQGLSLKDVSQWISDSYSDESALPFESAALGAYLITFVLMLIHLCFKLWPVALLDSSGNVVMTPYGTPAWNQRVRLLGGLFENDIGADTRIILLVMCFGGLGSLVHASTSFATYVGNRYLKSSWVWWYVVLPFIGMMLALIFYMSLRGGLVSPGVSGNVLNPFGIAALAGLVGLFSKQATDKLNELFTALFRTDRGGVDEKKDLSSMPLRVAFVEPSTGPSDGGTSVSIVGSGFTYGVAVTFDGLPAVSVYAISNTSIIAVTPPHAPGVVDVEVLIPDGKNRYVLKEGFTFVSAR